MRKGLTTLLVILLAIGAMLVSCKAEVGTPADELVSVSFEEAASRSITATLEGFVKGNYYWKYAAQKADDSGLTSGATEAYTEAKALPVIPGEKGLGSGEGQAYKPYKIPGFSQGLWNFKLWAYKTKNATSGEYEDLVFYGEAKNVSLSRGGDNTASVTVNPVAEGNGYIKIGEITFIPKKEGDKTDQTKSIEVTNPDGSAVAGLSYDSETKTYTVPAGAYKVTVKFTNAAQTIVYGEGYVIATVYSGLETLIGGNLQELVTYAQFDADLNPDAVNVQAESAEIQYGTGADVEIKTASTAEKQVKTSVARSDANAIITAMAEEQGVDTGSSTTLKLTLNVDPTDATETTITYEIGMKATLTYEKGDETQTSEKQVTSLEKYVIVEIEMSSGLSDVAVKHSGTPMYPCETKGQLDTITTEQAGYSGFYFYDPEGTLYIKTKSFSPFAISYTAPANYVAEVDGVKYGTLAEAVAKVKDAGTSTVKLLADVALTSTIETTKTFTLDLAGYDITAANCRAIHVQEGTLTLTGKGTIAAGTAVSTFGATSSVIRVGNNAGTAAGLVIGKDVTISSSYCYGVSIFGTETNGQTLVVDGKIKVTGTASAISGNGTSTLTATTITINEGAEVYAENDYAIYHPQKGTLTVAGGTIVGKGGIEAKGGNVIVNGGAITATAPTQSHEEYNNGASTSGYALAAVKNPNYPGDGSIRVNGGMITGKLILATDEEASFTTKLEAAGGTYTVDPTAYKADGCIVVHNADDTWTVVRTKIAKIGDVLYSTLNEAAEAAESGDTIELLCDLTFDSDDFFVSETYYSDRKVIISEIKNGVTFDGKNHQIMFDHVSDGFLIGNFNGTLCNLNVYYDDCAHTSIAFSTLDDVVMTDVCTYGTINWTSGNCGAYFVYPKGNLSLVDCVNYATLQGTGSATCYDAIFVGYAWTGTTKTYSFVRCGNEGSIVSGRAALFVANSSYASVYPCVTLDLTDCFNNGIVRTIADISSQSGALGAVNYFYAMPSDRAAFIQVRVDGETYTASTLTKWWEINDKIGGTGSLLGHVVDDTLSISKNNDGSFTIVPATNESVSYYVVSVGLYVSTSTGSDRYYVTEQLADSDENIITNIKDLRFVDSEWVSEHPSAVEGSLCNNKTYTYGNETYYLVDRAGRFFSNHAPRSSEMVSVSAYDANDKLVCAVQLIQP